MYSHIFCGTLETSTQESKLKKDDGLGIKLYKIELLKFQELVPNLINLLSSSDRDRANRYHFVKDKNRFVICRSLLKFLLAEQTASNIDEIILDIDSNRKPFLVSQPSVFFNVSHAGDYAIIVLAKNPVGVDIEYINKSFEYQEILKNVFNESEINEIKKGSKKHFTFYKFWTRKEAIVKAIGKGIDDDLIKIPVTEGLHSVSPSLVGDYKKITVFSFNLNDDYMGALAMTEDIPNFDRIVFHPILSPEKLMSLIS